MDIRPRTARLVLVTPDGAVVGALSAVPVATPWWQDIKPVVDAAREHYGLEIVVLRLLETEPGGWNGGLVTYLAEVATPVPVEPWAGTLEPHPLRQSYAEPGGAAADVRWAEGELRKRGIVPSAPAEQIRSWNLSSLWRIPIEDGSVWLKVVPPFFAHEGAMIEALGEHPVPRLIAHDGPRMLLAEIAGEDLHDADLVQRRAMLSALIRIQASFAGRADELLSLGLPDWRGPALTEKIASVVERTAPELASEVTVRLQRFVADLPERFAAIARCGLPDTLVHGDFHAGNVRGTGTDLTILDWGDCGVGHPLLDQPAFLEDRPAEVMDDLRKLWTAEWRRAVPGSDPERAAMLLAPVAAARQAVIYRLFLDNIEPSEHVYHASDPRDWLTRTAELLRQE